MTTYNHAFTISFSVPECTDSTGENITADELWYALRQRMSDMRHEEIIEACGMPFDTYEEEE